MLNAPIDNKPLMRHPEIEKLADKLIYEIVRFPMYITDEMVMDRLQKTTDVNVMYYISHMNGIIPIVTIGCWKSFVADFSKKLKRLSSDTSYNTRT